MLRAIACYKGSNMIRITPTQATLLRAFLKPRRNAYSNGLSSLALKGLGINRKTFDNHNGFLLNSGLIKIVREEKDHGNQTWKYYELTPVGFLAYLQYIHYSDINKIINSQDKFFPLLFRHWKKITKLYGKYSGYIFQRVLNYFDIGSKYYVGKREGNEAPLYINAIQTLTLPFQSLSVSFIKEEGFDPYNESNPVVDAQKNFEKIESNVENDFTFSFFFYLLNLPSNSEEQSTVWWEHHAEYYKQRLKVRAKGKDHLESLNEFANKIRENSIKILSIIKTDKELMNSFLKNLNFINKKFTKPKILTLLEKELR